MGREETKPVRVVPKMNVDGEKRKRKPEKKIVGSTDMRAVAVCAQGMWKIGTTRRFGTKVADPEQSGGRRRRRRKF